MASLSPYFATQFFTDAGLPAAGYSLDTFDSGTTTPKATYTDQGGGTPNANPIVLDSAGRCSLWLGTGEYTFVLKDTLGATVETWNDVGGVPAAASSDYVELAGDTMTGALILSGNATNSLGATTLQQVNSLIAASTKAAANVSVADAGGLLSASNAESAFAEIAAYHGRLLRTQVFTSSGTWTKGSGTTYIIVELVGAGGGTRNTAVAQGGGGAGGYSRKLITSAGATETVTIGAGAAATAGGTTSFGSYCSATGGNLSSGTSNAIGGTGGTGSGGDINLQGGAGGFGATISNPAELMGHGGNSYFGGGAPGTIIGFGSNTLNGSANTGGGGAGTNAAGGSGICIVYEFT